MKVASRIRIITALALVISCVSLAPAQTLLKWDNPLPLPAPARVDTSQQVLPTSIMFSQTDLYQIHHDGLGAFCRLEDLISKKSNVNLRMRLGSLDYVDRLENKVPAFRLNPMLVTEPASGLLPPHTQSK